jgi:hypothetical protein
MATRDDIDRLFNAVSFIVGWQFENRHKVATTRVVNFAFHTDTLIAFDQIARGRLLLSIGSEQE